jgi:ABC-type bacteriocin/lantibiotic exporter with double-glycine peptidase domain
LILFNSSRYVNLLSMGFSLKNLIFPVDSDTQAVYTYLRLLRVSVAETEFATLLREQADTMTLLSVSDVLTGLGVENGAAKVSEEQLGQLKTPFIAWMKYGEGLSLAVVKRLDNDSLVYLSPSTGSTLGAQLWVSTSKQAFSEELGGIILIGEAGRGAGQEDWISAHAAENKQRNDRSL